MANKYTVDLKQLRKLNQAEFHVRATINLLRAQNVHDNIRFLSEKQALFFLVRYFVRAIQTSSFFRTNSMIPTARSQSKMHETLTQLDWTTNVNAAVSFADFMQTQEFECSNDRSCLAQSESNKLHCRLRACVQDLQESTGWQLQVVSASTNTTKGNILQIDVPASVMIRGSCPRLHCPSRRNYASRPCSPANWRSAWTWALQCASSTSAAPTC